MATFVDVTDPDDPRLADYRDLRDVELRKHLESDEGLFIAEGEKVVRRAVEAGFAPRSFLMARRWLPGLEDVLATTDAPCYVVDEDLAEAVTGFHVHRGALASLHRVVLPSVEEVLAEARTVVALEDVVDHTNRGPTTDSTALRGSDKDSEQENRSRIAIFEDIVDHTNLGAGFRSAAALGVDAVLITPRSADPLYRRSIKVSMGTVFQVPWTRFTSWPLGLEQLKRAGYVVAALTLSDDSITLDELARANHAKLALVLGTEGHGIQARTAAMADYRVKIPMSEQVDSLNVAAAAAVAFYATR